jgi:hypothetical protein
MVILASKVTEVLGIYKKILEKASQLDKVGGEFQSPPLCLRKKITPHP